MNLSKSSRVISFCVLVILLAALPTFAERRALVIGIGDYTASTLKPVGPENRVEPPGRSAWPDLRGAVNDAEAMREMLISRYGFEEEKTRLLVDQDATRAVILSAIDRHLIRPSKKGDHIVFYYAGHGSQVVNSESDEDDGKDESLVPADSRWGAWDIRDKELRTLFNRILDRGAELTIIFDSCYSGSASRGPSWQPRSRGVPFDERDIVDDKDYGPRPADRGALVMSASQDFERAWETVDDEYQDRGAFSLALLRAMRAAGPKESADYVFLRAGAGIRLEQRLQHPVLAGNSAVRAAPLFGGRADHRGGRTVVAVQHIAEDGKVKLMGGWANGLTVGSKLRLYDRAGTLSWHLKITEIEGLSSSTAEIIRTGRTLGTPGLEHSALVELTDWASPSDRPLRVWIPVVGKEVWKLGLELERQAHRAGIAWVDQPGGQSPTHELGWYGESWYLVGPDSDRNEGPGDAWQDLGAAPVPTHVITGLRQSGSEVRLSIHLPVRSDFAQQIQLGGGTERDAVKPVVHPKQADYLLASRLNGKSREYAWVRPLLGLADGIHSSLPRRSDWYPVTEPVSHQSPAAEHLPAVVQLENGALLLAKLRAWLTLESPSGDDFPYRLALKAEGDGLRTEGTLTEGERYGLVLLGPDPPPRCCMVPRYVYVFVIDAAGGSTLLFPPLGQGGVENRFPIGDADPLPADIQLGEHPLLAVSKPFGKDTYFLLTTQEPIPNPWVLQYPGVRVRGPEGASALEELLSLTGTTTRSGSEERPLTPMTWSIERLSFDSVASAGG